MAVLAVLAALTARPENPIARSCREKLSDNKTKGKHFPEKIFTLHYLFDLKRQSLSLSQWRPGDPSGRKALRQLISLWGQNKIAQT
jgi:hypothetical protein